MQPVEEVLSQAPDIATIKNNTQGLEQEEYVEALVSDARLSVIVISCLLARTWAVLLASVAIMTMPTTPGMIVCASHLVFRR